MTISDKTVYEEMARQATEEDPHYVTKVTEMSDHKEVTSFEDIYATNGVKLISKNTTIGSNQRDILIKHKLCKPIDQSLTVQNGVTLESLARAVSHLIKENPGLQNLAAFNGDFRALAQEIVLLVLSPHMAFKLTVAKEQQPHLFQHLLLVTLIAHYLAVRIKLPGVDMTNLLYAALFLDLGELHINPELLNSTNHLSEIERHHIYAHPITSSLIVREVAGINPAVSTAILQHHERLDGSGYPYGLHGDRICSIARIVSVADVCASIFARFGNGERLRIWIRLNTKKYDPKLLSLLNEGFGCMTKDPITTNNIELTQLEGISQLFEIWDEFRALLGLAAAARSPSGELKFMFDRMASLRSMLFQIGFDPSCLELLVEIAMTDLQIANELATVLDEINWQLIDLEREICRRGELIRVALNEGENHHLDNWIKGLLTYLEAR